MAFDPIRAEMRFGFGLSPEIAAPASVAQMLDGIVGADDMAAKFPIEPFEGLLERLLRRREVRKVIRSTSNSEAEREAAMEAQKVLFKTSYQDGLRWLRQDMQRRIRTRTGFRERLVAFWGDHFTAYGKGQILKVGTGPYIDEAIRPHIAGRFEDMLIAAVSHPLMLHFLDQDKSIGPESEIGRTRPERGLNENLAREVLELHTLGVGGPYTQKDVRQLAELLTGLAWTPDKGTVFRKRAAEPGGETVLGKTYGPKAGPEPLRAALRDLARHPATARHIATKLAVHFVSDRPDPALIEAMTARYSESAGDLWAVYEAMLVHPAAWQAAPGNLKRPVEFMASALRALAIPEARLGTWKPGRINKQLRQPLMRMGQPWQRPLGPDGWAEEDEAWATPQGMAGRLQWALALSELMGGDLPDPRDFVEVALGPDVPETVRFAAKAAESRREGVALILMAPAFQRA